MNKLPSKARTAYTVPGLPENIIAGAELVDAGCKLHLDEHLAEIELEGKTLYRGWRDRPTRLWRFNIDPNDGRTLTPLPDDDVVNNKAGVILSAMEFDERTGVVYTLLH